MEGWVLEGEKGCLAFSGRCWCLTEDGERDSRVGWLEIRRLRSEALKLYYEQRWVEAAERYRQLRQLDPGRSVEYLVLEGKALERAGMMEEAGACRDLARSLRSQERRRKAKRRRLKRKIDDLISEGRWEEAAGLLCQLEELDPEDPTRILRSFGLRFRKEGRWEEVVQCYRLLRELDPDEEAICLRWEAEALEKVGRWKESGDRWEQLYRLESGGRGLSEPSGGGHRGAYKPDTNRAMRWLTRAVWAWCKAGLGERAEAYLCSLLEREPFNSTLWNSLGQTYTMQGKHDEALHCFKLGQRLRAEWMEKLEAVGLHCIVCGRPFPKVEGLEYPWEVQCPYCGAPGHRDCLLKQAEIHGKCPECGGPLGVRDRQLTGERAGLISGPSVLTFWDKIGIKERKRWEVVGHTLGVSGEEAARRHYATRSLRRELYLFLKRIKRIKEKTS